MFSVNETIPIDTWLWKSFSIILSISTLMPLRNLWVKSRCEGVVLTKYYGYAVVVQLYLNGVIIFVPNESYRKIKSEEPYLATCPQDVRFSFNDPYFLQVPKLSKQVKLMQLLVPLARTKWDLCWSLEELEDKRSELIDLVADLANSVYKNKISYYEEKLQKTTLVIQQVNKLMAEYDRYIERIEVAVKIINDFPDISSYMSEQENLIQCSILVQQAIKEFSNSNK